MPLLIRGNVLQSRGRVDWLPDGNSAQPSLTFATDPDTGVYRNGSNTLVVSTGGQDRFRINELGTTLYGTTPNMVIAPSGTAQYQGSSVHLLNNATEPTRRSASIGTYIRDGDGTDSYFSIDALSNANTYTATMARYDLTDHRWAFLTNNSEHLAVESDGNVSVTGNLVSTADVVAFASDRRLKADIQEISDALQKLRQLGGYTYTWRDDIEGLPMRGQDMGMIAQDFVDTGLHQCVTTAPFDRGIDGSSKSGESYLTILYNKVHAITIQAIKELAERVENIERRLDELSPSGG
jgi:hypothetical protein